MESNIVLLTFADSAKAYQALSELKQAAVQDRVKVLNAAVVERDRAGSLLVKDGYGDGATANAPLVGTLLGSLLGVLGGPLGVLMVGATGMMLGSLASLDTAERRVSLLEQMTQALPPGSTGVFANVEEGAVEVIDGLAKNLGAVVLRRPTEAILAEVGAAQEAQDAAAQEARKVLRAKHRKEWDEKWDKWTDDIEEGWKSMTSKIKSMFDDDKPDAKKS